MLHDPRPPHLQRKAAENKALHPQGHEAGWTPERVELLKERWAAGDSATEIAMILGGGVTRNGVIGKVTRLKLPGHAAEPMPKVKAQPMDRMKGQPKANAIRHRAEARVDLPRLPLPEENSGVDVTHLLGILQINEHTCKWPAAGEGSQTKFCGEHSRDGSPYCDKHYRRAYIRL